MASWYGSDIFIETYKEEAKNFGGYFSYVEGDDAKCIFYSRGDNPQVLATIIFDKTYDVKTAKSNNNYRDFTPLEKEYYTIRHAAALEVRKDTLFKTYKNTRLNLVPLIYEGQKKVYILTGTGETGLVVFGNDYLITFDKDSHITSKKQLHLNALFANYGNDSDGNLITGEYTIMHLKPATLLRQQISAPSGCMKRWHDGAAI